MEMEDSEVIGFDPAVIYFGGCAQIENAAHAEAGEFIEFDLVESVKRVSTKERAPFDRFTAVAPIPTEIPEVECPSESDVAIGMVEDGGGIDLRHVPKARG
jgi:hypothetical protein